MKKNKEFIKSMFASISPRYDLLNHLLSLGFDRKWRKRTADIIVSDNPSIVLDVCAGTLDLSIAISSVNGFKGTIVGSDFCKEMLDLGRQKAKGKRQKAHSENQESEVRNQNSGGKNQRIESSKNEIASASISPRNDITQNLKPETRNLKLQPHRSRATDDEPRIFPLCTDTLYLPFKDNSFDAITSAFGIRNIQNLRDALIEMRRVIRNNGKAVILEFYRPKSSLLFSLYLFYFRNILPLLGRIISGDKKAYSYLRDSVTGFLSQEQMKKEMELAGFKEVSYENLTLGIVTIHIGKK